MSDTTAQTNGTLLTSERLTEIKSLLRYETSISFHSARAKESMLLLVAEVERQAAELAAVREERDEAKERLGRICGWNPVQATTGCDWDRDCPVHGEAVR